MNDQFLPDDDQSNRLLVAVVFILIFAVAGAITYFRITNTSETWREECQKQCDASGEDYAVNTAGTAGGSMQRGRSITEPTHQCICVARQVK
jgi:hypothetical protein